MRIVQLLGPIVVFAAACSGDAKLKDVTSPEVSERAAMPAAMTTARVEGAQSLAAAPVASFWATQKLIRTAALRIQVRDVTNALKLTDSIAQSQQTLLANSRTTRDADGKQTAEIVLRVPSQQFAELLKALRALGAVQNESVGAQDVTKEYADLETRLAVKQQTVTRLRGLLENRTAKLSDVLEVERELGRAVAELEQMKGEQRYYDQQIALSTVSLTLFESVPSRINQFTKPIAEALQASMEVLGRSIGTVIYLVVALVPWVVIGGFIAWLAILLRRRFFPKAVIGAPTVS